MMITNDFYANLFINNNLLASYKVKTLKTGVTFKIRKPIWDYEADCISETHIKQIIK